MNDTPESGRARALGGSIRRLGETLLDLFETRVGILSLEWAEERGALIRLLFVVVAILACLQIAIVLGLVFLLLAIGDEHRVATLGLAALALLLAAAGGVWWLRRWLRRRRPMFATTIEELRKDREWIRGKL
jgi:uncharacterized membrane protein YqjE